MSKLFGGGGGQTVNTVQNSDPWEGVQPYLTDVFSLANQATHHAYNSGNLINGQSPYTLEAQQMAVNAARDPNSLGGQAQSVLGNTISGQYLSPDSNPYLKASVEDALGLAGSAFAKQYGGAAGQNLGNSGYQEALARGLGATATNAYSNAYQNERQNQLNALQLAPSFNLMNSGILGNVGAQQEARERAEMMAPWEHIANYQRAISGQFGGQTSGQQPYYSNPLANALGLGLGGLALYNGLGSAGLFGGGAAASAPLLGATTGAADIFGALGPLALV